MKQLTFNDIPDTLNYVLESLIEIKQALSSLKVNSPPEQEALLTIKDTAKFLSLSIPTVYALISQGELPVMKRSKRCYFLRQDLINYIKAGRRATNSEIEISTDQFLNSTKK